MSLLLLLLLLGLLVTVLLHQLLYFLPLGSLLHSVWGASTVKLLLLLLKVVALGVVVCATDGGTVDVAVVLLLLDRIEGHRRSQFDLLHGATTWSLYLQLVLAVACIIQAEATRRWVMRGARVHHSKVVSTAILIHCQARLLPLSWWYMLG